ncbi:vesicle-trafficking protein SEC22a-like isoform X1 [Ornithodoros turicata]|uniref:vesicle-trafficking protein SEC22a-like isoform X1 n=1 Tax=Ornithodoros turicata TaxID=34597 RepID=UPI00313A2E41
MILYALIVRTHDGLPLSASTDVGGQIYREIQETRKHIKQLSKKLTRLDDRCTLRLNTQHVIHFISSMGVSFLALCEISYQPVLAFSFLDQLMREFIILYNTHQINKALRPYTFIEFDSHIQKMRQRYNSGSLTSKVNLSNLMEEMKQRPPQQLKLENIISSSEMLPSVPERVGWLGATASNKRILEEVRLSRFKVLLQRRVGAETRE